MRQEQVATLDNAHYLGAKGSRARYVFDSDGCVMVFASPSSRRLPRDWLELSRWCITSGKGSCHWSACVAALRSVFPDCATVVSYSDPSVGHTGALYRACNWIWAPTWHALRPPPSGMGTRGGKKQAVKHRWIFPLKPDATRAHYLRVMDKGLRRRFPAAEYVEPKWRGLKFSHNRADAFRQWEASAL